MPEGRISDWDSTETECSFKITGLAKIGMKLVKSKRCSEINIISHGKNPFGFQLNIFIESTNENSCISQMVFEADINPFMKTMVATPLTNFFNMLVNKLKEINE